MAILRFYIWRFSVT